MLVTIWFRFDDNQCSTTGLNTHWCKKRV